MIEVTKVQLFSETTKHFGNYFRIIFNKNLTTGEVNPKSWTQLKGSNETKF
jgi:hypothetical protein